ncbi:Leucine-rich repeat, N-terminal domain containing protein [Dorcoceras hygrometricum]|uniref:Leucine-rich repeat, N-terminal domain containing protein n=1 Tax=Dorcoceras hygrometricum TaxID=472368 RepID=A0A2Z7A545_9LAMI|nr:Leucine-rich repeat, N-terminal domain containing protein [Dorcoceras hygrometricum]
MQAHQIIYLLSSRIQIGSHTQQLAHIQLSTELRIRSHDHTEYALPVAQILKVDNNLHTPSAQEKYDQFSSKLTTTHSLRPKLILPISTVQFLEIFFFSSEYPEHPRTVLLKAEIYITARSGRLLQANKNFRSGNAQAGTVEDVNAGTVRGRPSWYNRRDPGCRGHQASSPAWYKSSSMIKRRDIRCLNGPREQASNIVALDEKNRANLVRTNQLDLKKSSLKNRKPDQEIWSSWMLMREMRQLECNELASSMQRNKLVKSNEPGKKSSGQDQEIIEQEQLCTRADEKSKLEISSRAVANKSSRVEEATNSK